MKSPLKQPPSHGRPVPSLTGLRAVKIHVVLEPEHRALDPGVEILPSRHRPCGAMTSSARRFSWISSRSTSNTDAPSCSPRCCRPASDAGRGAGMRGWERAASGPLVVVDHLATAARPLLDDCADCRRLGVDAARLLPDMRRWCGRATAPRASGIRRVNSECFTMPADLPVRRRALPVDAAAGRPGGRPGSAGASAQRASAGAGTADRFVTFRAAAANHVTNRSVASRTVGIRSKGPAARGDHANGYEGR